jgi:hypothetical protein
MSFSVHRRSIQGTTVPGKDKTGRRGPARHAIKVPAIFLRQAFGSRIQAERNIALP